MPGLLLQPCFASTAYCLLGPQQGPRGPSISCRNCAMLLLLDVRCGQQTASIGAAPSCPGPQADYLRPGRMLSHTTACTQVVCMSDNRLHVFQLPARGSLGVQSVLRQAGIGSYHWQLYRHCMSDLRARPKLCGAQPGPTPALHFQNVFRVNALRICATGRSGSEAQAVLFAGWLLGVM